MRHRFHNSHLSGLTLLAAACSLPAHAFTVAISPGPRAIYLQVGVGSFSGGNFNVGGQPQNNATVNTVSVTVPTAVVGTGTAQAMTSNSGAANSFYDGFAFCNAGQLYVGGFYRFTSNSSGAAATVTASSSTPLSNGSGGTIPFTQIAWVSSGNGDTGGQPFASATFNGTASQSIGSISRNQWAESCKTFRYLNGTIPAAGTFTGTVTYTLTAP